MPSKPNKGKTQNKESQPKAVVNPIKFDDLKAGYPSDYPCNQQQFPDQCAIKVSVALVKAGVKMSSYEKKERCWFHEEVHALRAEKLAEWLKKQNVAGIPKAQDITGENWKTTVEQRTGIIFFANYWLRKGERYPSGDHIDLWDKSTLVSGGVAAFLRFFGINSLNLQDELGYTLSDLGKATQILFWEIK